MKLSTLAIGAAAGLASAGVVHLEPASICDKSAFKGSSLLSDIPSFVEYCDHEFPVTTSVCKGKTITDTTTSTVHETKTKTLATVTETLTTGLEGRATITHTVTQPPKFVYASTSTISFPLTVSYNCSASDAAQKRAVNAGVEVSASVGLTFDGSLPTGKGNAKASSALSSYKSAFAKLKTSKSEQKSYAKTMCGCVETVPVCTPSVALETVKTTIVKTLTTQKTATHDVSNTHVVTVATATTVPPKTLTLTPSVTHTYTVSVCASASVGVSVGAGVSASVGHATTTSSSPSHSSTSIKPAATTTKKFII